MKTISISLTLTSVLAGLACMHPGNSPVSTTPAVVAFAPRTIPDPVRGLYVNRWAAVDSTRLAPLIGLSERTEVNALVIDVKDDRGYVLYPSSVPLAKAIGADTTNPMPLARVHAMLDSLHANGITAIARIVVAKDPLLASKRPALAIERADRSGPWLDVDKRPWLDATHREVWQYAADLANEAGKIGFDVVQFDYVRFPDDPRIAREATFPLMNGRTRAEVIRDQLRFTRSRIARSHMPMTIDVFGLTTTDTTDMGIGQKWELFAPNVDAVLPMTYPSHYGPGLYGLDNPNAHPYDVIARAMADAKARNANVHPAPRIIPWYQDFTQGQPPYGASEIRAQMQAGYDAGVMSWMLWNPGSSYTETALMPAAANPAKRR